MSGYYLTWSLADTNYRSLCCIPNDIAHTRRHPVNTHLDAVTWGDESSDVLLSRGETDMLIFYGYITESLDLGRFSSQQVAVDRIRVFFQANYEDEREVMRLLKGLNGCFSIVYISEGGDVVATHDRCSTRPLWYTYTAEAFVIGTNPLIVSSVAEIHAYDPVGLGSFILYGSQVVPTHSLFKDVNTLDSGEMRLFYRNGESRARYWYRYSQIPDDRRSMNDWVEDIAVRLQDAAARIGKISPRLLIFLSGGLDSRLLSAALRSIGIMPLSISMADSENHELRIARKVAATFGFEQETLIRDTHWYLDVIDSIMFGSGGSTDWVHGHFSRAYRTFMAHAGIDAAMLGMGLEYFNKLLSRVSPDRRTMWTDDEFIRHYDSLYPKHYEPANRASTMSLLAEPMKRQVDELLRAGLLKFYHQVRDMSSDPRIVMSRMVRWHSLSMLSASFNNTDLINAGPERSIMFDTAVLDVQHSLPSRFRDHAGLGSAIIRRLWPKAAHVVNSNTMLPPYFPEVAHHLARTVRPLFGRMRRSLYPSHKSSGSWGNLYFLFTHDSRWREEISSVLYNNELFSSDVFNHDMINRKWHALLNGDYHQNNDIARLYQIGKTSAMKRYMLSKGMMSIYEQR